MRAVVIERYGEPDVLTIQERPMPEPKSGHVVIEVMAFGLNHAEIYFRQGVWGDGAEITGIECVGMVHDDPDRRFHRGQKVMALVGGMGRSINGSYAAFTQVPCSNVVAIESDLAWETLAAIPESYATAWTALTGNLRLAAGDTLLIRGASSSLGQAAVNIAAHAGARVIATLRNIDRAAALTAAGAQHVTVEQPQLSERLRELHPGGVDAVLDIVGTSTILDSLRALRKGGRACLVGFLGGGGALACEPVFEMPSDRSLSVFASALVLGSPEFPLSGIPFQAIVDRVADGTYRAAPARVFGFAEIRAAHRLMESHQAGGKIVVRMR